MEKILLVDDDIELCELVARYLRREGFEIEAVHNGALGLDRALKSDEYSLMVLDVMLPGLGGFEVLKQLRAASKLPVLMLTARGEETDRIVGLEFGADDYLPKPFNPGELAARIRAILRRAKPSQDSSGHWNVGDIEIESGARVARKNGEAIELTGAEFDLLALLLQRAGTVVSREELVKIVLGRPLSPYDRSIDTLISNLRRKLGHSIGDSEIERIKSVRGSGYLYAVLGDR